MKHLLKLTFGYNDFLLSPADGAKIMELMQNAVLVKGYADNIEVVRGLASLFTVTTVPASIIDDLDKAALLNLSIEEYHDAKQQPVTSKK